MPQTVQTQGDARCFVALDLPSVAEAEAMVEALGDSVESYKIGLQLLPIGGVELGQRLKAMGKTVFYDFKFHDIGATVEKATRSIAGLNADLLTVHARPDVMKAAVQALRDIGYNDNAESLVMRRVEQALEAGLDGVVSSPLEAAAIRANVPESFLIVTPGVRPKGADVGDQKRIATPSSALNSGATHLVIGRPITQAADPRAAALSIAQEMSGC